MIQKIIWKSKVVVKTKENEEIIATFDEKNMIQTRGWGESCYPTVPVYK